VSVEISKQLLADIHGHCERAYPRECCGALVGALDGESKTVLRTVELDNTEPESPERRFAIDPRALIALERDAAASHQAIVGFYHSHPDWPARPSPTDLDWAWPVYSYAIVSVANGIVADTGWFVLSDQPGEHRFTEESARII
jgi:proteasome lid subunit RPN8/RPN11